MGDKSKNKGKEKIPSVTLEVQSGFHGSKVYGLTEQVDKKSPSTSGDDDDGNINPDPKDPPN